MLHSKGIRADSDEVRLLVKLLQNEYDYGFRSAEQEHNIPTQRAYGTDYVRSHEG